MGNDNNAKPSFYSDLLKDLKEAKESALKHARYNKNQLIQELEETVRSMTSPKSELDKIDETETKNTDHDTESEQKSNDLSVYSDLSNTLKDEGLKDEMAQNLAVKYGQKIIEQNELIEKLTVELASIRNEINVVTPQKPEPDTTGSKTNSADIDGSELELKVDVVSRLKAKESESKGKIDIDEMKDGDLELKIRALRDVLSHVHRNKTNEAKDNYNKSKRRLFLNDKFNGDDNDYFKWQIQNYNANKQKYHNNNKNERPFDSNRLHYVGNDNIFHHNNNQFYANNNNDRFYPHNKEQSGDNLRKQRKAEHNEPKTSVAPNMKYSKSPPEQQDIYGYGQQQYKPGVPGQPQNTHQQQYENGGYGPRQYGQQQHYGPYGQQQLGLHQYKPPGPPGQQQNGNDGYVQQQYAQQYYGEYEQQHYRQQQYEAHDFHGQQKHGQQPGGYHNYQQQQRFIGPN